MKSAWYLSGRARPQSPLQHPGRSIPEMSGTSAHLSHLSPSPSLRWTSAPPKDTHTRTHTHTHTHTQTHTSVTLPLMTRYTADKIPEADCVTLPQKRSTERRMKTIKEVDESFEKLHSWLAGWAGEEREVNVWLLLFTNDLQSVVLESHYLHAFQFQNDDTNTCNDALENELTTVDLSSVIWQQQKTL